jgi:hypothetical protein
MPQNNPIRIGLLIIVFWTGLLVPSNAPAALFHGQYGNGYYHHLGTQWEDNSEPWPRSRLFFPEDSSKEFVYAGVYLGHFLPDEGFSGGALWETGLLPDEGALINLFYGSLQGEAFSSPIGFFPSIKSPWYTLQHGFLEDVPYLEAYLADMAWWLFPYTGPFEFNSNGYLTLVAVKIVEGGEPPPVPVPGAFWLLGSGLAVLLGGRNFRGRWAKTAIGV